MDWGFEINPYKPCFWNNTTSGEQFTIVFHVDDLKISHSTIIPKFESIYATIGPMAVHRGKVHHYLGMAMDIRVQGEVQITMYDYIKKVIDSLPEDMIGNKHTAAPEYLFRTDEEATKLSKNTEKKSTRSQHRYYG